MFSRILVANRGEIALRVLRTCREMGIESVIVYSKGDEHAYYLEEADARICIGGAPSAESYLNIPQIISAAEIADVDAIHPGYGFLSENAHFAEICESSKITFIGPSPDAMRLLGDKAQAKSLAIKLGVPVVPGSEGILEDDDEALRIAHEIGFPVMIKASAGGGGRGMRVAHNDISLINGLISARREAEAAFKNGDVYLEKFIEGPRHIEVQILADSHGNVVHLGERDCSLQRRHQKLVEESPSPAVDDELREKITSAAIRLMKDSGYTNAGTVEFLLDKHGNFFFIEVNARLQVEHPVTEMVTGLDLVQEQVKIAYGEALSFTQEDVAIKGHAIECRINAEDPVEGFRPSPGRITDFYTPGGPGVRVDSHVYSGYQIPPHYDSMIGKLIVYRPTRKQAIDTMRRALREYRIEGVKTTIPLLLEVFGHGRYVQGSVDTSFIETLFS